MASDFAREFRDKKIFYDLIKTSSNPQVKATNDKNHLFKYFNECKNKGVNPLPILFKVYK